MGNEIGRISSQITDIFQRQVIPALCEGGINQDSFVGFEPSDSGLERDDGLFQILCLHNEHDEELCVTLSAPSSQTSRGDALVCLDVLYGFAGRDSPRIRFRRRSVGTWEVHAFGTLSLPEAHPIRRLAHDDGGLQLSERCMWRMLSDGEAVREMTKTARSFDRSLP